MQIRSLAFRQVVATLAVALGAALHAAPAAAELPPQQVLDRVFAYNTGSVLNMAFGNADRPPDFTDLQVTAGFLTACTLTSVNGLYCLDGRILRRWPNPLDPTVRETVLSCTDPALGIENTLLLTCTGMTVDRSGVIWLAGKKKVANSWPFKVWSNPYIVVKVTKKVGDGDCPAGTAAVSGGVYCAKEAYTGKYIVTQLSPVDGDAAESFKPCSGAGCDPQPGILGIEDLKNVVFFPSADGKPSIPIPAAPHGGLKFGEVLDDVHFLVVNGRGYVLATTNSGHVLKKDPTDAAKSEKVFHIPQKRAPGSKKCSIVPSHYAIRSAPTSTIVFVSDGQYCQVSALEPNEGFTALVNMPKPEGGGNFVLFTRDPPGYHSGVFPTFGLTVAPGIGIDFSACELNCAFINSVAGEPAAEISGLKVVGENKTGGTAFQEMNLSDCRYAEFFTVDVVTRRARCAELEGVVINPGNSGAASIDPVTGRSDPYYPPEAQMLNVRLLLSNDVISGFESVGITLPPELLMSPLFSATVEKDFFFGALVVVHDPAVQYKGVFYGEYDVRALEGEASIPEGEDDPRCVAPEDPTLSELLNWSVTTALSETHIGVGGKYIDSLANVGCGSIRGSYGRLSVLPFSVAKTKGTYGVTAKWWLGPKLTQDNDAVFARLVESLIDDLEYVYKELACKPVDSANTPLPADYFCQHYNPARVKLKLVEDNFDRCLVGAFTHKHLDDALPPSWRNRPYCDATLTALDQFHAQLPDPDDHDPDTVIPPPDAHGYAHVNDVANRLGELHSRVEILKHVYTTRFVPSIPYKGYCKELNTCSLPF